MPTVIDSLVVELGLDPKKFTQGQKEAAAAFLRTRDEARKSGKGIEEAFGRTGEVISRVQTRMLGLLSLFAGGYGLKEFVANTTKVNAETGRTAQMLDTTTKALSTWRTVATLTGGTAQGITGAIGGLVSQFQNFALTGESNVIPYFRALRVDIADASGRMRKMDDVLLDLADRFSKLDPAKARAFGQALGFDDATISLLIRGRDAVGKLLTEAKNLGTVSKEDAEAAGALQKAWNAVETSVTSLGRTLLTAVTPQMVRILKIVESIGLALDPRRAKEAKEAADKGAVELHKDLRDRFGEPTGFFKALADWLTGGKSAPSAPGAGTGGALRTKPDAGTTSVATAALAQSLQAEIPGLDRFTAFNDTYHALLGRGSAHQRGQALDFTLKDPAQSAAVAAQVQKKLAEMGIDARVIDEYANPSRGSTGGHIHVQFNSAAAAQRYSELAGGATGAAAAANVSNRTSTSSSQVSIGKVEVHTQASDAEGIARDIKPAIERNSFATQANSGPQ